MMTNNPEAVDCSKCEDGELLPVPGNPYAFVCCRNGQAHYFDCPPGRRFDPKTKEIVADSPVKK